MQTCIEPSKHPIESTGFINAKQPWLTSQEEQRVQPFDVNIEKPFKNYVHELFEQYLDTNLELYIDGNLAVGERRVLTKNEYASRGSM